MARSDWMYSRMRDTGFVHSVEKRRRMCPLTWDPRPSTKRPPDCAWRSHDIPAVTMGLRGNATTIPVPSWTRSVASAANASGVNGSCEISAVMTASKPASSAACAAGPAPFQSSSGSIDSTIIRILLASGRLYAHVPGRDR
jgi:hypothetical protein